MFPGGQEQADSSDEDIASKLSSEFDVSSMASGIPKIGKKFKNLLNNEGSSSSSSVLEVVSDKGQPDMAMGPNEIELLKKSINTVDVEA